MTINVKETMRVIDGNHELIRRRKFNVQELALLITEIERLAPRNPLMSRNEAAQYINSRTRGAKGYTGKALANLASRGMGPPYFKLGTETFYSEQDIEAWLSQQRRVPSGFYDCDLDGLNE